MTIWKEIDGWTYEYFKLDTPASEFPGFEKVVKLWNSKREGGLMPRWADFDFYDFKGWHGKVNLAEIEYDPFSYIYKLFGTESAELVGEEWTGKNATEIVKSLEHPEVDMAFYKMSCENAYITHTFRENSIS